MDLIHGSGSVVITGSYIMCDYNTHIQTICVYIASKRSCTHWYSSTQKEVCYKKILIIILWSKKQYLKLKKTSLKSFLF